MASPLLEDGPLPLGFTEFHKSGQEDYNFKDGTAQFIRIFDGLWTKRHEFIFDHIFPRVTTAEGRTFFNAPNYYPEYQRALPYRATVEGLLKTNKNLDNFIKHDLARITVYYEIPSTSQPPSGDSDTLFVEENVTTETEILPLPAYKFTYSYEANGNIADYAAYKARPGLIVRKATADGKINHLIKRINYKLKIPYVIAPRWGYIAAYLGSVNKAPFITPSGLFAAPEQLRFDGISSVTKRDLSPDFNKPAWEMEFTFVYYKPGWHTKPTTTSLDDLNSSDDSLGDRVVHAAITPKLYPDKYHQLIFTDIPKAELLEWHRWFTLLEPALKNRFYDPEDELDFTPAEIKALTELPVARPLWVA